MEGHRETGVVIHGGISKCYLCFTYTPGSTAGLVFWIAKDKGVSKVPEFRVNSISTVYYCTIHNLLSFS